MIVEEQPLIEPHTSDDKSASAGQAFRSTLEDILLHVALHGAYHRGQLAMLVRDGHGEPAPTDYIAFVRGVAAARTVPPPLERSARAESAS